MAEVNRGLAATQPSEEASSTDVAADVKALSLEECDVLAGEIRQFLVEAVSRTGGHLGSNLGAVELTIALHRVFDSPSDMLVFDTGHQAYVQAVECCVVLVLDRQADVPILRIVLVSFKKIL